MKNRIVIIAAALVLFSVSAHAAPKGYIVRLAQENLLLAKDYGGVQALEKHDDFLYYEPNYAVELFDTEEDEISATQWNLKMINAEKAWNLNCYGNGVKVGVIDTGISAHIDINASILPGYNYLASNSNTADNIGHGTFVSGIIAAQNTGIGIAHRAKIVPLKCFDSGATTYVSTIVTAIYAAVDVYGCKIINISSGLPEDSRALKDAVDYAVEKGVIVVAAVGNYGTGQVYYPAGYDNVIGVGSVDSAKNVSSFSQKNTSVFVTAPGDGVTGLSRSGNQYRTDYGTSFAAPVVTGIAAIAESISECIGESLDASSLKAILRETAHDLGEVGYDVSYGYGLVDMERCIEKLLEKTTVFVSPLDKSGSEPVTVKIYNNSGNTETFSSVFAEYVNAVTHGIQVTEIVLAPFKKIGIEYVGSDGDVKHFLWRSPAQLLPVGAARSILSIKELD